MVHTAGSNRAIVEPARIALGVVNEFFDIGGREVRAGHQHQIANGQFGDRRKVPGRVIGNFGVERLVQAVGAIGRHQKSVAVAGAFGHQVGGNDLIGAGFVVHHKGLAPAITHGLADGAHHHVGRPARAIGQDDADGFVRVSLGLCKPGPQGPGHSPHQDGAAV